MMNKNVRAYTICAVTAMVVGLGSGVLMTEEWKTKWSEENNEVSAIIKEAPTIKQMLPETDLIFPGRDLYEMNDEPDKCKIAVFETNVDECDAYIERAISLGFEEVDYSLETSKELRFKAKSTTCRLYLVFDKNTETAYIQADGWGEYYKE